MLALSRRPDEVVCIGDNIEVMVTKISGDRVVLAIKAPKEVKILRKEIRDKQAPKETPEQ